MKKCPLQRFGWATCSRKGEDITVVKTHLSWHPGLIEFHETMLGLSKTNNIAKVLQTTTQEENPEEEEESNEEETNEELAFGDKKEKSSEYKTKKRQN